MPSSVIFEQPDRERMVRFGRECTKRFACQDQARWEGVLGNERMIIGWGGSVMRGDKMRGMENVGNERKIIGQEYWKMRQGEKTWRREYDCTYIDQPMVGDLPATLKPENAHRSRLLWREVGECWVCHMVRLLRIILRTMIMIRMMFKNMLTGCWWRGWWQWH